MNCPSFICFVYFVAFDVSLREPGQPNGTHLLRLDRSTRTRQTLKINGVSVSAALLLFLISPPLYVRADCYSRVSPDGIFLSPWNIRPWKVKMPVHVSLSPLFLFSVQLWKANEWRNIIFSSITSFLRPSQENVTAASSNTQLLLFSFYLCVDRFLCFYFVDFQLTLLLSFVVDVPESRELCVVRDTPALYDADKSMAVERVVLFLFFLWTMYGSSFLFFCSLFTWQSEPTEYSRHKKMKDPKWKEKKRALALHRHPSRTHSPLLYVVTYHRELVKKRRARSKRVHLFRTHKFLSSSSFSSFISFFLFIIQE